FQHDTGVYLVMEMIKGEDLGGILKKTGKPGVPVDQAIEYTRQACEALQYVHDQQIVHRDVKPANLINAPDKDGIVLVDFGVARQLGEAEEVDRSEEHTSELQSLAYLVCRLLLEKKKTPQSASAPRPTTPSPRN